MRLLIFATFCLMLFIAAGCQEDTPQALKTPPQPAQDSKSNAPLTATDETTRTEPLEQPAAPEKEPPSPPIFEDFQGEPQLTLFPRAGDFRPADDSDRLAYWNTFIDHLIKVTGVAEQETSGNRAWVFRGINTIDSVGFFSPLSVEPQTEYQVSFKLTTELAAGASAGIGILEFDEFLWNAGQYTEEIYTQHFRGSHEGQRLTGTTSDKHTFTFTTGPETEMIHIVLFREGTHDRNSLMFDDIGIKSTKNDDEAGAKANSSH